MTTASKITILRILLIPIFMAFMLLEFAHSTLIAFVVFAIAGLSDWLDGHIARKYDQISSFGKFMDPLADKLLVTAAMLIFVQWGRMPAWVVMLVLAREFAVSGLRMLAAASGEVIAAGVSGKIKTVATFFGLMLMMMFDGNPVLFGAVTLDCLVVAVILLTTVYSGIEYFVQNRKVLWDKGGK